MMDQLSTPIKSRKDTNIVILGDMNGSGRIRIGSHYYYFLFDPIKFGLKFSNSYPIRLDPYKIIKYLLNIFI
jgi:hypothetical protein